VFAKGDASLRSWLASTSLIVWGQKSEFHMKTHPCGPRGSDVWHGLFWWSVIWHHCVCGGNICLSICSSWEGQE